jgi:hypothetical protein
MTVSGKFFLTQLNGLATTKTSLIGLYIETRKVPWTVFNSLTPWSIQIGLDKRMKKTFLIKSR